VANLISDGQPPGGWLSCEAAILSWFEPDREDRAVLALLGLFIAVWTTFQVVAYSAVGLNDDLAEVFVWSQNLSLGYSKHPPLAAFVAAIWFSIFPTAEWAFHLLAMLNSAVGLFFVDRIARRYVDSNKRLLVLLLLLLTPFYQFHGQRFSPNPMQLSTWPIATLCFLRAFATRRIGWSALAGATAALAMLAKYYSIYLIGGFVVAAMLHPRRWEYLRSPAPWVSIFAGFVVLAPNLYWLATTGFEPFAYAVGVHGGGSAWDEWRSIIAYLLGALGYVLLPLLVYGAAVRPDKDMLALVIWPQDADRRMLVILLGSFLLLPALTAPLIGVKLTSLWTMSSWFLLPIVLLAPKEVKLTHLTAARVATGVATMTMAILAAAPVVAWVNYVNGLESGRAYDRIVGEEVTRTWRAATGRPLRIVIGVTGFSQATSFYSPDHPDAGPGFGSPASPWLTILRGRRDGWGAACSAADQVCISDVERSAQIFSGSVRVEKTLTVSFFGWRSTSKQFVFYIVPPQPT